MALKEKCSLSYMLIGLSIFQHTIEVIMKLHILKGIVHPKMKIVSSFTLSQVFPNLYECLCSAEHKGRYSEELSFLGELSL